jgi:hypothetical protein
MSSHLNALKKTILSPVRETLIAVNCAVDPFRSCLDRIGITPAHFGNRVVRVPIRKGSEPLLLTGADDVHLAFQLFWRGIDYYEPFTRTVIEGLSATAESFKPQHGYNVIRWTRAGINFWAVSDLERSQLAKFVDLLNTAMPSS